MIDLNTLTKQVIVFVAGFIAFFVLIGYAGSIDCAEEIICSMPQHTYEQITQKLGPRCTNLQIAREYMNNKKHYDSLND